MAYAHSANALGKRHDLIAHLRAVGLLTAQFAEPLGAQEAGYWLGLWHDVGKFDPAWQEYLLQSEAGGHPKAVDHKAAGATIANRSSDPTLKLMGPLIQGHHGGLRKLGEIRDWLNDVGARPGVQAALLEAAVIPDLEPTGSGLDLPLAVRRDRLESEFFLRLLFSALIDADRLDTERHFTPGSTDARGSTVSMGELWSRFEGSQAQVTGRRQDVVGRVRDEVYQHCLAAAASPPGLFRLAAPTGAGKTRSAMAFALRHAMAQGLQRIIVAVPFISITEQTAGIYREVFQSEASPTPIVLEHHSGGSSPTDDEAFDAKAIWTRLSAENWDAPVIVTTMVQLFESLFAARTSATRKIHRLAKSVIILDEAQALPPHLLVPILSGLRSLVRQYGATVVVSTATQPAFDAIPAFQEWGAAATDIVPSPERYFDALRRVAYEWMPGQPSWGEIAGILGKEPQSLTVVNTKKDALDLLAALGDPDALHLSTFLCGRHRAEVIRTVAARLRQRLPCRLVSTQVVEAGVDLDFPVVLRALAPLDSIIQAAGRCNREGTLVRGRVIVFEPAGGGIPPGAYRTGRDETRALRDRGGLDPDDPATARRYFELWLGDLGDNGVDRAHIQESRGAFDYPRTEHDFQMIEPTESAVVTQYGNPGERTRVRAELEELREGSPRARFLLRRLQPFVVPIHYSEVDRLTRAGLLLPIQDGISEWLGPYDPTVGVGVQDFAPEALII